MFSRCSRKKTERESRSFNPFQGLRSVLTGSASSTAGQSSHVSILSGITGVLHRAWWHKLLNTFQYLQGLRVFSQKKLLRMVLGFRFQSLSGITECSHGTTPLSWLILLCFNPFQGLRSVLTSCSFNSLVESGRFQSLSGITECSHWNYP